MNAIEKYETACKALDSGLMTIGDFEKEIAPLRDVVPVIHGTWERHMSFGICDKCGYEYNWTGTDAKNFCPNCGAKMDAKERVEWNIEQ